MEFEIKKKIEQNPENYKDKNMFSVRFVEALANELSENEYHELAHQLYKTASEFDEIDGECTGTKLDKKYFTVLMALSRGIFWSVIGELEGLEKKKNY